MSQAHDHASKTDVGSISGPSRMAARQERFRKEVERRIRELSRALRITVRDNNALDLGDGGGPQSPRDILQQDPVDRFEFVTQTGKESAFVEWWNGAVDEGLLDPMDLDAVGSGEHWTATHIDSAYEDGIRWSDPRLKEFGVELDEPAAGTIVQRPTHQEALRTVRTRAYENLEDISEEMSDEIGRILSDGLGEGIGPNEMARRMTDEVRASKNSRGRTLARSEVMNAHSVATGARYQEMGVEYANIATSEPCSICAGFRDAGPHPLQEAVDALPLHPNCVCCAVPAMQDDSAIDTDWTGV